MDLTRRDFIKGTFGGLVVLSAPDLSKQNSSHAEEKKSSQSEKKLYDELIDLMKQGRFDILYNDKKTGVRICIWGYKYEDLNQIRKLPPEIAEYAIDIFTRYNGHGGITLSWK